MLLPLVIHKGLDAPIVVPANSILVVRFSAPNPANAAVVSMPAGTHSSLTLTAHSLCSVGSHTGTLFTNATLVETGRVYVGAGITAELSENEATLQAIDAVLAGKASDDIQSYTVAGRAVAKMSTDDLIRLRSRFELLVKSEKLGLLGAKTGARFKNIVVR